MRGTHGEVGSTLAIPETLTTRWPATAIRAPTRSDHDGPNHRAAAAAPHPPHPARHVCSRSRIRDGGSTAADHIEPGTTTDLPHARAPLPRCWPFLRAQQRGPQSADGWPCKPPRVAALRRLAGWARGPGRAAASACPLRSAGRTGSAVAGGALMRGGALSGPGAPLSGAADRSGRRPRAASARGPRKRAALIQ